MSEGHRRPPRIAVLGTGAISQIVHVPMLAERDDVELVALSDQDVAKARTVAQRVGVAEAVEPGAVLEIPDLDAAVIATPNAFHEEMAVAALEAGLHVFVERPLALTPAGAERVLAAARDAGRVLVVGLPHRFRPDVAALRSFVAGGELGRVHTMRGSWLTRPIPVMKPTWRQDPEIAGGGALLDLGIPALDLTLWLLDHPRVERVACTVADGEVGTENAASLLAAVEGGITLSVEVNRRYFASQDRFHARVMGAEGSGSLPPLEIFKQLGGRPLDVTPRQPRPRGGENPYSNAYRRLIDHFVRALCGQVEAPLPTEQVGLMTLVEAAYRSARSGQEEAVQEHAVPRDAATEEAV
ncbi:MAG: Gfo/Idh/MocA family protein [Gemmatimonadota bacterium]